MRGKLATCTEEHHWSSSRSSKRNLTENPPFCTWSSPTHTHSESSEMDLGSALSWTQEMPSLSSFFPPVASLLGHRGKPAPLSLEAAPLSRSPSSDSPEERKLPPAGHRAQSEGKASCARGSEGALAPPCGPPEQSGQPRAHTAQRAPPEAALQRALRLKAQTQMEQNSSMTPLKT